MEDIEYFVSLQNDLSVEPKQTFVLVFYEQGELR